MDESTIQSGPAGEPAKPARGTRPASGPPSRESDLGLPETALVPNAGDLEPPARKRNVWMIGGLGLLVIVLAAAAYVGGRWLNRAPAGGGVNGPVSGQGEIITKAGGTDKTFQMERAKELPQSNPDLVGVLVRRQDNSLFLGTGKLTRIVQKQGSESQASAPSYDGPVLEAVVTHDTQIFRDETTLAAPTEQSDKIQQIIKPGSLDEISTDSTVQVWGEKTGERTVARILVYQPG